VVTDSAEYRFALMASENRGFVTVIGDKCKSPAG